MKDELVEMLKSYGFTDVWIDNGVVMVGVTTPKEMKQVEEIVYVCKYNGSWGMKIRINDACN